MVLFNNLGLRYKILISILGIFIITILFVSYYQTNFLEMTRPTAESGEIDLTGWDFANDGTVQLDGKWELYWQQQVMPQSIQNANLTGFFEVPDKWRNYVLDSQHLSGDGYATYRLHIKLGMYRDHLALKLPQIDTAYKLWIDGQLVSFIGTAGTDAYETKPRYLPQVIDLKPNIRECDLVIQVSNFDFNSGGIKSSIQLGDAKKIHKAHEVNLALALCLLGIFFIMAAYHFCLYRRLRTKDKSAWYFGLFCLLIAIRSIVTGELLILQAIPNFNWELLLKLDHSSSYLATLVFVKFIYYLYAEGQSKLFVNAVQFITVILTSIVVLTPIKIYLLTLMWYYAVNVFCIFYVIYVIIKAIIAGKPGAVSFACGSFILLATVVNDMLYEDGWLNTGDWLPLGLFVFMFFQAALLSTRFAGAFANLELMSENLQKSNQKINHILASISEGFFTIDSHWRFTYINKEMEKIWQRPASEIMGRVIWDEVSNVEFISNFSEAMQQNKAVHFEFFSEKFNRWLEVNACPFREGFSVFVRDIQERKMADDKLKEYAKQLREQVRLLDLDPEYNLVLDLQGVITFWNQGAERGYGWAKEEALGQEVQVLLGTKYPKPLQDIWAEIFTAGRWIGELIQKKKDGSEIIVRSCLLLKKNMYGEPESIIEINNDITAQRNIEREMARLAQLNLIGQMAAGISHEVRNPMATVRGFLQLLSRKKDCAQYGECFNIMIEELDRANAIITEFLSVAKPKNSESAMQDVNRILTSLLPLLKADAVKSGHEVEYKLGEVPDLLLNGNEIRQMILNLARNGMEAMSHRGILTIATYVEGDSVVMSVKDQGKGIDSETLTKLGTPFFTTKDGGTGLGLAVCYGIAARHNAVIDVQTGFGGTAFYIRFKLEEQ